jgi:hypothetical protein
MDRGSGVLPIVAAIHERYGTDEPVTRTALTPAESDWDTLYPISDFLETYRFPLPPVSFHWPRVVFESSHTYDAHTKRYKLRFDYVSTARSR